MSITQINMSDLKYITPTLARQICDKALISPHKAMGQNFMVDPGQVQRIVQNAKLKPGDTVLEIGPGLGSLTLGLLDLPVNVIAIELDKKLYNLLPETIEKFASKSLLDNLQLFHGDALKFTEELPLTPIKIVSNLPYNVGVPIFLTLLRRYQQITDAQILVQLEVAQRLTSAPGSKVFGIPSLKSAWYGTSHISLTIPRSAFWPVPRVDSALVEFHRHKTTPYWQEDVDVDDVFSLINLAFSSRRKTFRSLLVNEGYDKENVSRVFDALQIDPMIRGEMLNIVDYCEIAKNLIIN